MAASDSPPIGLSHPTVEKPKDSSSGRRRRERVTCVDCAYTVELGDDLPPKCPECGGALTFDTS